MKTAPGLSAACIRGVARELAARLADDGPPGAQPGQRFFPKRLHELSVVEGEAPDGLAADYVVLAARLNQRAAPGGTPDLLGLLLGSVEAEITRARVAEARLIAALDGAA